MPNLLETDKKVLGKKLRDYRKIKKYTQFQLAEKVGLNEKQISRIEAGINYPTYTTFAKLIDVLGINILEFFDAKDIEINKTEQELISIIKESGELELKIYSDIIKPLRKNLKKLKTLP